jgi:hypothetical protein
MDFVTDLVGGIGSFFGGINFEAIFQIVFVSLIMIAGPVVVLLLFLRGGDL